MVSGWKPLHRAVCCEGPEAVATLIRAGVDVNERDRRGETPLHLAIRSENAGTAAVLIEAGADVDVHDHAQGATPLHLAASPDTAAVLIEAGADVNAQCWSSFESPLHIAARTGNLAVASLLIDADAYVNASRKDGYTPLCLRCG